MYIDNTLPYKVADMSLAEWGRKEIEISEHANTDPKSR